ncbi:MAG: RHS repeat protein [Alphaproteobacteria bacterium]|nr:RHS repeat protein [Alphaproteobacteria bacterium]
MGCGARIWGGGSAIRLALLLALGLAIVEPSAHARSVSYAYDALGRLTSATYSDGRVIEYAYDPAGGK